MQIRWIGGQHQTLIDAVFAEAQRRAGLLNRGKR